jgi:hypothetical protein
LGYEHLQERKLKVKDFELIMNLLGFEAPYYYEPSLLTFDYNPWAFTCVHEDYTPPMDNLKAIVKK